MREARVTLSTFLRILGSFSMEALLFCYLELSKKQQHELSGRESASSKGQSRDRAWDGLEAGSSLTRRSFFEKYTGSHSECRAKACDHLSYS